MRDAQMEGVMPKETIKEWPEKKSSKPRVEVRWGPDHHDSIQLTVDRGQKFSFNGESSWYTGLTVCLEVEEDIDRLIKALKKAKKQTQLR